MANSLLDMLLSGTRFDQRNTLDNRIANQPGLQPGQAPVPAQPATSGGSYDPEAMIRQLRLQRQLENQGLAQQALQKTGGQVLPQFTQPRY